MADIITAEFATEALAAGGITLSAAATSYLPSAITAASDLIRRWCGDRDFVRQYYDEIHSVEYDGTLMLRQIPVQAVPRVSARPAAALVVTNTSPTVNQRAVVRFDRADHRTTPTGLVLSRTASGVTTTNTLDYEDHPTLASLAGAVNGLGNGWSATVEPGFELWSPSELIADGTVARNALSGAELSAWSEDIDACLDERTGLLTLPPGCGGTVRVVYEAGFDPVPLSVQQACVEVVMDLLRSTERDPRLQSEDIGDYSYTLAGAADAPALTASVQGKLAPYRLPSI